MCDYLFFHNEKLSKSFINSLGVFVQWSDILTENLYRDEKIIFVMIIVIIVVLALFLSLFLLVKSADLFVEKSIQLGTFLKLSPFMIGFVFVALGTSFPELATSLSAAFSGTTEFVVGNVIGSNIANIGLVLALSIIFIEKLPLTKNEFFEYSSSTIFTLIILGFMFFDKTISVVDGILLVCILPVVLYTMCKKHPVPKITQTRFTLTQSFILILSSIGIYVFAESTVRLSVFLVERVPFISDTSIIGLTVVAIGTSLPELSVSISALRKKEFKVLIGNILGSNMLNVFFVMGLSALITPLVVTNSVLFIGFPILFIISILLLFFMYKGKHLRRWEGFVLGGLYITYVLLLFLN